jgi:GNAT superfamily N-acetyltransferase
MRDVAPEDTGAVCMEVTIRAAEERDLVSLLRIYRESGLDERDTLSLEQAKVVFRKMKSYPNYRVFVADWEGIAVGAFALLIMDNLVNGGLPSGVVEDVAVVPVAQGKGVGKRMMAFALDRCREAGCYKMTLSSNQKRVEAHRFYESLGFDRHGFSFRVELEPSA